jgi:hypothetical protein
MMKQYYISKLILVSINYLCKLLSISQLITKHERL